MASGPSSDTEADRKDPVIYLAVAKADIRSNRDYGRADAAGGVVMAVDWRPEHGHELVNDHGNGVSTRHAHRSAGCGQLCGFNTTLGGQNFLFLFGGSVTFNFAFPIDDFGFYITGLQTDLVPQETLTFSDGSTQTINTPTAINGGGALIGFTDFGKSIVSVTYNATNDIVAIDDVRFSIAAVPEPGSLALVGIAALALGALRRRRR